MDLRRILGKWLMWRWNVLIRQKKTEVATDELNTDLQVQRFSPVLNEALASSTPFVHIIVDHAPDQGVIS